MPSTQVLEAKKKVVEDLSAKVQSAAAGVIVNFSGITVEDDTALRKELREAGVVYTVVKNTLIKKALEQNNYDLSEQLHGMTAIATCEKDQVVAAKILKKFADKIETFDVKAGFVDGTTLDKAGVEALASLPSREQLIAKVLGSLQSPLYGLAYVLQAYVDKQNEGTTEEASTEETVA